MTQSLESLRELLAAPINEQGYELYDLEFVTESGRRILRLTIDHPNGIQLDDCVRANHTAQTVMDAEDPVQGSYTLEVSSPGIFRVLKLPEHFQRFSGARVRLRLRQKIMGVRNAVGLLNSCTDEGIRFHPENRGKEEWFIDYLSIARANLEPELTA